MHWIILTVAETQVFHGFASDYDWIYNSRIKRSLTIFDVEHCVLAGEIVERQKDKLTAEWKYRITGENLSGRPMELIGKISPTGKLVIITVYLLE